jgi:ribonuclease Z
MNDKPEPTVRFAPLLEQRHPFRQWKTWVVHGTSFTISGYSRANDKTFFHLPELKCCLDAGLCEGRQPETVLLSHAHHDHSNDLEFLASRAAGVDIYLPVAAVPYAESFIRTSRELNQTAPFDPKLAGEYRLHGVRGGDTFPLGKNGVHVVRVFECIHKVPCVGYGFSEKKRRLLPEFERLKTELTAAGRQAEFGKTIAQKRKEGVAVDEEILKPLFTFLGDTQVGVFERYPELFDYPVLLTECTYLDDADLERAQRVGHTVWSQLRPIVAAHPKTQFVLTHFSLRHSEREIATFFAEQIRSGAIENLDNVMLWANPESALPEQHQSSQTE